MLAGTGAGLMPLPTWSAGDGFTTGDAYTYIGGMAAVAVAVAVTSGQQSIADQSWTGLLCAASEDVDSDGILSLASFQSHFIAPYDGYYIIDGQAAFGGSSTGSLRQVGAIKNGSTATFYGFHRSMDLSSNYATIVECTSVPIGLVAGDYIEIACYHDAARDLTMGVTRVGVYRLRGL